MPSYLSLLDEDVYAQVVEAGPKRNTSKLTVAKQVVRFLHEQTLNPTAAEKIEIGSEPAFYIITIQALAQEIFGADARPEKTRTGSLVHSIGFHTFKRDGSALMSFNKEQIDILKKVLNV